MNCPGCSETLVVVERDGIELDWCIACRGLWFDQGELELLGEKAGRSLSVSDLVQASSGTTPRGRRRCPRCPQRMERLALEVDEGGSVEIDYCPDHGFWLDHGELGRIMAGLERTQDTDEGLVLEFLGETFAAGAARSAPADGRRE